MFERFTYASPAAPAGYVCAKCGAAGCKLWRQYQTFADHIELMCVRCAGKDQGRDVSDLDERGRRRAPEYEWMKERTDSIGWLVPAVPTEDGTTFWGYTSVPEDGCAWWYALPNTPRLGPGV